MTDSYDNIIQAWAKHRHDVPSFPLFEMLACEADRPELVTHARYVAALENIVAAFMRIEPEAGETIH
jgi:hypothetical protein